MTATARNDSLAETSVSRTSFFGAYLTAHTVAQGAYYLVIFRIVGTAAFPTYGLGNISNSICRGQAWSVTIKEDIDGLVYALRPPERSVGSGRARGAANSRL